MQMKRIETIDPNIWNKTIDHPLQSYEWGEFRKKNGSTLIRFGEYHGQTLIRGYQCTLHTIPYTKYVIGYIPKCPSITKEMISFLRDYGKHHRVIFFQIEPNTLEQEASAEHILQTYRNSNVRLSHHPLFTKHTFVLDLTKNEEELLSAMHSKTRYNIKIAQKHNVEVKEDNSEQAFQEYLQLNTETTQRQGFYAHSSSYHKSMWETLHPAGIATLWTARYNKKIVAAWILFTWKKTLYYPYGTSSRDNRNVMAPYLLLWNIILWAKLQKLTSFDLWGALGEHPNEKNPFYGFHRFKSGFSPALVTFQGSFDIVIFPFWYQCYCIADTIRWKILKLLK